MLCCPDNKAERALQVNGVHELPTLALRKKDFYHTQRYPSQSRRGSQEGKRQDPVTHTARTCRPWFNPRSRQNPFCSIYVREVFSLVSVGVSVRQRYDMMNCRARRTP